MARRPFSSRTTDLGSQLRFPGPARSALAGFTLIELLVVIAIIGILAGILLPMLAHARGASQGAACRGNLKQIAQAFTIYLSDYDNCFPPVRWGPGGGVRWQNTIGNYIGRPVVQDDSQESTTANGNLIVNQVLNCPSVHASKNQALLPRFSLRDGSYGYNWQALGPFAGVATVQTPPFPVRLPSVTNSNRTILAGDSFGSANMTDVHSYTLDPPKQMQGRWGNSNGVQTPLDNRHDGKGNVVFVDSHVESLTLSQAGYNSDDPTAVNGTGSNALWNGTGQDP